MFHGEGSRHVNGMMQYLCNVYERESVWHGHSAIASEDIYQGVLYGMLHAVGLAMSQNVDDSLHSILTLPS